MSSTELSGALWRKSSYSNGQANCVEVAAVGGGRTLVAVRDSKAPDALRLIFTTQAWRQFTDNIDDRRRPVRLRSATASKPAWQGMGTLLLSGSRTQLRRSRRAPLVRP
jgi:hypothetical protein